jgi:hypothetical protein
VERVFSTPRKKPGRMLVAFPMNKLDPETFEEVAREK